MPSEKRERPQPQMNVHPETVRELRLALESHGVGEHFDAALGAVRSYRDVIPTSHDMRELAKAIKAEGKPNASRIKELYEALRDKERNRGWWT